MDKKSKPTDQYIYEYREMIGKSIRALREKRGHSQDELAEIMQVHRSTISKVETGKFSISIDYLVKFAWYLDFESLIKITPGMADVHTAAIRSYNMSRIKSKDTKPEMIVRKALFANGFRFRLHDKRLPGKPHLVFKKYKTVVLINKCFWHGYKGYKYFDTNY